MKRIAIAAALLALAGCGSDDTTTVETDDGTAKISVDTEGGDNSMTITTDEGEVKISGGAGQKVDMPAGFTVYPGAEVINSSSVVHADGAGVRVMMSTEASPVQVVDYYRRQAEAAGIAIKSEATVGQQIMVGGEGDNGLTFSLTTIAGEPNTTVNLLVSQGFGS